MMTAMPSPAPPATAVAYFDHLAPAGTAIAEIFRHGHEPTMMEIMDQASIRRVEQHFRIELDTDAACLLLIQAAGDSGACSTAAGAIEAMAGLCDANGASFVYHVADPAEGDMLVEVRRRVGMAMDLTGLMWLPEDVAVPRQRLAEDAHFAVAGRIQPAEQMQQRALAGTRGADNRNPLARHDFKVDAQQHRHRISAFAVRLAQAAAGNHRLMADSRIIHNAAPPPD